MGIHQVLLTIILILGSELCSYATLEQYRVNHGDIWRGRPWINLEELAEEKESTWIRSNIVEIRYTVVLLRKACVDMVELLFNKLEMVKNYE